jgi:hypothetical protein
MVDVCALTGAITDPNGAVVSKAEAGSVSETATVIAARHY